MTTHIGAELPDAQYIEPEANDLVWSDLRGTKQMDHYAATEQVTLAGTIANISGFLASDGLDYGQRGQGHIRVNFAAHEQTLNDIFVRVGQAQSCAHARQVSLS